MRESPGGCACEPALSPELVGDTAAEAQPDVVARIVALVRSLAPEG